MAGSDFTELKGQFERMQEEIEATLAKLKELPKELVIAEEVPEPVGCLPFHRDNPPPQVDDGCERRAMLDLKGSVAGEPILPSDIIYAVSLIRQWNENIITVLRGR